MKFKAGNRPELEGRRQQRLEEGLGFCFVFLFPSDNGLSQNTQQVLSFLRAVKVARPCAFAADLFRDILQPLPHLCE